MSNCGIDGGTSGRAHAPEIFFALKLPAGTRFLTVEEIPYLTARVVRPDIPSGRTITGLFKTNLSSPAGMFLSLDEDDLATLKEIWSDLPTLPLSETEWEKYKQIFEVSPHRPAWGLIGLIKDERRNQAIMRAGVLGEHECQLKEAIRLQEIRTLSPLTHLPENFTQGDAGKNALVSLADFIRFAATVGISVTAETAIDEAEAHQPAKRVGRPPKNEAILEKVRTAARAFYSTAQIPLLPRRVIAHSTFIAMAFGDQPNLKGATTSNARKKDGYARNFGIARRAVLEVITSEHKTAQQERARNSPAPGFRTIPRNPREPLIYSAIPTAAGRNLRRCQRTDARWKSRRCKRVFPRWSTRPRRSKPDGIGFWCRLTP